jgi:hypothetical protein
MAHDVVDARAAESIAAGCHLHRVSQYAVARRTHKVGHLSWLELFPSSVHIGIEFRYTHRSELSHSSHTSCIRQLTLYWLVDC